MVFLRQSTQTGEHDFEDDGSNDDVLDALIHRPTPRDLIDLPASDLVGNLGVWIEDVRGYLPTQATKDQQGGSKISPSGRVLFDVPSKLVKEGIDLRFGFLDSVLSICGTPSPVE